MCISCIDPPLELSTSTGELFAARLKWPTGFYHGQHDPSIPYRMAYIISNHQKSIFETTDILNQIGVVPK